MRRFVATVSSCVVAIAAAGCFEIEQTVELDRDLSGSAGVMIGIDFEPMVLITTMMKRGMEGKEGPPTEKELEEARAEFLAQSKKEGSSATGSRDDVAAQLPEGIELLDLKVEEGDLSVRTMFRFGFDHLSRLEALKLPSKGEGPTDKNVVESPFDDLEVLETAETLTIRGKPQNPSKAVEGESGGPSLPEDPEIEAMMEKAMSRLRVAWRITTPFEVISHNATRIEGKTLVWEYDLETFKRMEAEGNTDIAPLEVVFRR